MERHQVLREVLTAGWRLLEDPKGDLFGAVETLLELTAQLDVRGPRNFGEATVLAVAEHIGATAVLDDRDAYSVGRRRGVHVIRTLRLLGEAVDSGVLTEHAVGVWLGDLERTGSRLPRRAVEDFVGWWSSVQTRLWRVPRLGRACRRIY